MISMLVCSGKKQELQSIRKVTKDCAAYQTEEKWNIYLFDSQAEAERFLKDKPLLDIVCFDVEMAGGIQSLMKLRLEYKKAYIILIAGMGISPAHYMIPEIMAAGLLLRPIDELQINQRITSMIRFLQMEETDEELFLLEDREGRIRIPYKDILFFESREKKIFVCLENMEYGFYGTLENLCRRLPEQFVRCHRGFIVNTKKIKKAAYSENLIYLENGMLVPLSRSYKSTIKEHLK